MAERTGFISVCTGSGMLDRAVELALPGTRPICYMEREVAAAALVAARVQDGLLANATVWSDIRSFDAGPWRGKVSGVIGGIPCQGNSLAGKRQLEADERNLWPDFWKLVCEVDADWLVIENVAGIAIPADGARAPAEGILEDLAQAGWSAEWATLQAGQVGASHKRERWFMLACRDLQFSDLYARRWRSRQSEDGIERGCEELGNASKPASERDTGGFHSQEEGKHCSGSLNGAGSLRPEHAGTDVDNPAGTRCHRAGQGPTAQQQSGLCGHTFNHELLGKYGCPNCEGEGLADASEQGQQGRERRQSHGQVNGQQASGSVAELCRPLFAPGPSDTRWSDIIQADPSLEPAICRMVDGLAPRMDLTRTDRLRITGNGVVELQAAVAIRALAERITETA